MFAKLLLIIYKNKQYLINIPIFWWRTSLGDTKQNCTFILSYWYHRRMLNNTWRNNTTMLWKLKGNEFYWKGHCCSHILAQKYIKLNVNNIIPLQSILQDTKKMQKKNQFRDIFLTAIQSENSRNCILLNFIQLLYKLQNEAWLKIGTHFYWKLFVPFFCFWTCRLPELCSCLLFTISTIFITVPLLRVMQTAKMSIFNFVRIYMILPFHNSVYFFFCCWKVAILNRIKNKNLNGNGENGGSWKFHKSWHIEQKKK